jgi:hypothetical protein
MFVKVRDLTVPKERLEEAILEADKLPSIEITELDLQWIQVCKSNPNQNNPSSHSLKLELQIRIRI